MDQSTKEIRISMWKNIIKQCQNRPNGVTVSTWCNENNVKLKTYYYYLRKFRKEAYASIKAELSLPEINTNNTQVAFAEISPQSFQSTDSVEKDISFKPDAVLHIKGVTLAVSNTVSESLISTLIRGVNNAC